LKAFILIVVDRLKNVNPKYRERDCTITTGFDRITTNQAQRMPTRIMTNKKPRDIIMASTISVLGPQIFRE
jgi:hypothetical protein